LAVEDRGEQPRPDPDKVIWDGHTGSITRTTQQANAQMSIDEQIAAIHANKGLTKIEEKPGVIGPKAPDQLGVLPMSMGMMGPGMPGMMPGMMIPGYPYGMGPVPSPYGIPGMGMSMSMGMGMPPLPPGPMPPLPPEMHPPLPPDMDLPSAKKQKLDADITANLIPEEIFLAQYNKGSITLRVQVPDEGEKPEWNFKGQTVTIQATDLRETIASIKEKLKEHLGGMPPNKQKLKTTHVPILKDQHSLAFYNIADGAIISLGVKERGGRKK